MMLPGIEPASRGGINVLALVKGSERYIFLFDDDNRIETLRQIGRFAANPDLSFTWYDAAVLSQRISQSAPGGQADLSKFAAHDGEEVD